jgi:hypothetical protein
LFRKSSDCLFNSYEREIYDKVIYCPKCGSANVSAQYCCHSALSFDIKKSSLIEHIERGYLDAEENFARGDGLFCPKRKRQMHEEEMNGKVGAKLTPVRNPSSRIFSWPPIFLQVVVLAVL